MTMMPGMPWHSLFALRHSSRGHGYDMDIYIYIYIYIYMTLMHMLVRIMMSSKKRQDGNRSLLPFKGSLKAPESTETKARCT